jgi:hypothetical protein
MLKYNGPEAATSGPEANLYDDAEAPGLDQAKRERKVLLDRLDVIEQLSHWKLELQVALWRKKVIFLYANSDTDFRSLADEVRDFKRVSALLTYMRKSAL